MKQHKTGQPCPNKMRVEVNGTDLGVTSVGSTFCSRCKYHLRTDVAATFVLCCYDHKPITTIRVKTF